MRDLITHVISRALRGVEDLTLPERADLYEGISDLLRGKRALKQESFEAFKTAKALREADQCQLKFSLMVKEDGE